VGGRQWKRDAGGPGGRVRVERLRGVRQDARRPG